MKLSLIFISFTMCLLTIDMYSQSISSTDPDKAKLDSITRRVRNGERAAILEEANIRPDISIPALSIAAQDKSTDPVEAEFARQALSQVKGVEDYLKQKIDAQSGKQTLDAIEERAKQLELLSLVHTNKAIRTIASYLFDDKNLGFTGDDYTIVSTKIGATVILDDMRLPGAPSNQFTDIQMHVAAWRTWWLKNQSNFSDSVPYAGIK